MSEGNGTPVTRAELAAHIKGIDDHFDSVESHVEQLGYAVAGVGLDVKKLLAQWSESVGAAAQREKELASRRFWANAAVAVLAAFLGAAIGTGIWFIV